MKFLEDVIIAPVVTERSMDMLAHKKYVFRVHNSANKPEIAEAVEKLFKVKVKCVNTVHMPKQPRRRGYYSGYKPAWKKAIVTLTDDSKTIEFFDGMM